MEVIDLRDKPNYANVIDLRDNAEYPLGSDLRYSLNYGQKEIAAFNDRVLLDSGTSESNVCSALSINKDPLNYMASSLFTIPNSYKEDKLYSVVPTNGTGDLTWVRNTTATRVNSSGLIESVGANVPRLDYTGGVTCPCILVEPQRTNLNLYSEDISNAYWTKYQLTVATNSIASPDGATTADKLVESVANDAHFIYSTVMSATQVVSVFLKYNGRPIVAVGNASQDHYALFNIQTGVVTSTGSNSISNGTIKDYGNGWYRCSCLFTYSGVNRLFGVVLTDNNNLVYTGNGVSGVYIWGAQREVASTLTSYIPTTSGTVTRNADVATVTTPVGITSLIETYEDNTTNVVNPIPVTYQMSEGRIAKVVGL